MSENLWAPHTNWQGISIEINIGDWRDVPLDKRHAVLMKITKAIVDQAGLTSETAGVASSLTWGLKE